MIRVCDAIMGSGKTQSTITYFNEHPNDKFIYITPYLDEASRIREGCPDLEFVEPSNRYAEYRYRKTDHTAYLISQGKNITTTHQAFKGYSDDMLVDIKRFGYTLFIDENVDVLEMFDFSKDDLDMVVSSDYVIENNGIYSANPEKNYQGGVFTDMFRLLRTRNLVRVEDDSSRTLFYWALPPELLTSFRDVYILTYLFEGQSLHHFLQIYDLSYEYIGIEKTADGFRFGPYPGYVPEYVTHLRDKLHIVNSTRMNMIGDDYYALSMNWFNGSEENIEQLQKNTYNCIVNSWRDIPADKKMWGSYNGAFNKIKGRGYTKSFVTFNTKATNEYRDRICLVYLTNIFMNVGYKRYYEMFGIEVDEDKYALSIMVQWIWRSAIRDGEEVYIYIPSKRMRTILNDWINSVSEGGE